MSVSRPAGEMRAGAWRFIADLDPVRFYKCPSTSRAPSVNYKAIAVAAGIAPTCVTKIVNGDQPLTAHVAKALVRLVTEYDRPGRRPVSEDRARRAMFTGDAAQVPARQSSELAAA